MLKPPNLKSGRCEMTSDYTELSDDVVYTGFPPPRGPTKSEYAVKIYPAEREAVSATLAECICCFKFKPRQYVKIKLFNLGIEGRVRRCGFDGVNNTYLVEYAMDGKLIREEFLEDVLEAK